MIRISLGSLLLALGVVGSVSHAVTIDGTAPSVEIVATVPAQFKAEIETRMNAELSASFDKTLADARENTKGFHDQKNLAQGFGNANAYSMNSATLQGFQNYSIFAVATGLMVGVQAPSADVGYYGQIADDIQEKGDLYAGFGVGFTYLNVGLNAKFIKPGLYLNVKYGGMKRDFGDFGLDFKVMGVGVNYRLLEPKSLIGLVKWRGISLGSGFYYQGDKVNFKIKGDSINTPVPFRAQALAAATNASDSAAYGAAMDDLGYTEANPNATMTLLPGFNMGMDISTMTIPFDAVTAVSLLWGVFNVTAGVGFDLNFGSDKIIIKGDAQASTSSDTTKVIIHPSAVSIDGSSDNGPSFARLRFMTGLGLGLGPVKFDIPVIYFPSAGMAFGLSAMVVW